jgi:hypothetical protein
MHRQFSTLGLCVCLIAAPAALSCDGYMRTSNTTEGPAGSPATPTGNDGDDADDPLQPPSSEVCSRISPGETPLPRLTEAEYNNTLRDLFPTLELDYLAVPGDEKVGPFDANTVLSVGDLIAEQYQRNAEAVSQKVGAHLDQVLTCSETSSTELYRGEAEDIGANVGAEQGEFWNLWSNGSLETNASVDRSGSFEVAVRAYGTRSGSDLPRMVLSVNGDQLNTFEVDALQAQPSVYTETIALEAGTHTISVAFSNDAHDPDAGTDRNLIIDYIALTQNGRVDADEACVRQFIEDFGRRAYRRTLTDDEKSRLWQLFAWGDAEYGTVTGIRTVIEALLQSPKFLYRFKFGEKTEDELVALDDFEVASRLSYFLWDSMPDDALMSAADAGELSSVAGIEAQTRRMLETQKARRAVNHSFMAWMGLADMSSLEREDPEFTDEIRESMEASTLAFIDQVIWEGDGKLSTLLTAPFAYVDKHTAPLYGVEPPADDSLERVTLDEETRLGLLTQPAVLARYAYGDTTVHRGLFIRDAFLCSRPPPPPNEFEDPPETYETQPLRERAEDRMAHQQCGACHHQIDPLGLAFDQFDPLGRWQSEDAHGNVLSSDGRFAQAPVDGAVELARALAGSEEVRQCVVRQWFRLAFARTMSREDACSLQALENALTASDDDIRELLVAITTSDAFRYRLAPELP